MPIRRGVVLDFPPHLHRIAPFQAVEFVEVVRGVEVDVEFEVAGAGFDADGVRGGALAGVVGAVAHAVGILEEVDLGGLGRGEVDVVFGCYGVVGVV